MRKIKMMNQVQGRKMKLSMKTNLTKRAQYVQMRQQQSRRERPVGRKNKSKYRTHKQCWIAPKKSTKIQKQQRPHTAKQFRQEIEKKKLLRMRQTILTTQLEMLMYQESIKWRVSKRKERERRKKKQKEMNNSKQTMKYGDRLKEAGQTRQDPPVYKPRILAFTNQP